MGFFNPTPPKSGDVLLASRIAAIEAELRRLSNVRGGAGLDVRHSRGGLAITGNLPASRYIGVATSAFAARSGSTPASGSVDVYWLNPASGNLETTGISIAEAWNASSTTMTSGQSIDSGMYVWVEQDPFDVWWVSPLECS